MTQDNRLTPLTASLPATVPFVGPEAQERQMGRPFEARLGANELVFGPSPKVIAALQTAAAEVWKYPDPEAFELRQAIAAHHGVAPENIALGEGIDGLLGVTTRLFLAPGEIAVTSLGAYPTFNYHVAGHGGTIQAVPYTGDHEDPERLIAKARETHAKLIYISNPDNPMGSWHRAATIQKMIEQVPNDAVLLLDEAYVELAPAGTAPPIDPHDTRVLRFRTFSKAYGMAGARVGYVIGAAPLIAAYDRIKNHFGLSRLAQAGALAAIADQDGLAQIQSDVAASRAHIAQVARQNDLCPLPSATNFVTLDCGRDGDFARAVLAALVANGIFARMPFVAPQDRCIRIGTAPRPAIEVFAKALCGAIVTAKDSFSAV